MPADVKPIVFGVRLTAIGKVRLRRSAVQLAPRNVGTDQKSAPVPFTGYSGRLLGVQRFAAPHRRTDRRYACAGQLKKRAGRKSASSALCRPPTISSATAAPRNGDSVTPLWVMAM